MKKNLNKLMVTAFTILMTIGAHAQTKIITTVGGTGVSGFSGDNAAATAAKLSNPSGVAVDDTGNIYIVDKGNYRIRKISKTGIITTIAGNGGIGYSGDHAAATAATLSPNGIAVDLAGNVFIADQGNNCIRKINKLGIITTVAGDTANGFAGDHGPATAAKLSNPSSVAVDVSGNLFITDQNNNRIRKVDTFGIITTVAGGGTGGLGDGGAATTASLSIPSGIAVDASGNLFIIDQGNNRVRKVTAMGLISTYAGTGAVGYSGDGGAAIAATFNYPISVAVDGSGNVYVVEGNNNVIRKIDAIGNIYAFAGKDSLGYSGDGGAATAAKLKNPTGVAVDTAGKIYIADLGNNRIRKVATVIRTAINPVSVTTGNIELLPNPNNGTITVRACFNPVNDEDMFLQVTDMLGKVVYKNTLQAQNGILNTQIILNDVADGIYLLNARSGNETYVSRFVMHK